MVDIIYISWRKEVGSRRYLIARIRRSARGLSFSYRQQQLEHAKKEGLEYISGFQDVDKLKDEDVHRILALRVIKKERSDSKQFLDFWEASGTEDIFDLVSLTQGKSPTDNLEFLGVYHPKKGLKFVTDLAGLSHEKIEKDFLQEGDILTYRRERYNSYDRDAIAVFKGQTRVGYVKRIHTRPFCEAKEKKPLHLVVKAVEQNGFVKQVFVKVEFIKI